MRLRSWSKAARSILLLACACAAAQVSATAATTGSLTVLWNANTTDADLAGYRVYLSLDAGVFSLTPAQAAALATTRTVDAATTQTFFSSLDPGLVYWIAVTSFDSSANESGFSNVLSAQPLDITPPATSMTAPAAGSTVSGTVTVSANASDDVAVVGVQFTLDGVDLLAEDTSSPYAISWDTTTTPNGSHTIGAVARDAAGNTTSSSRTVTVSNTDPTPPTVSMTAPANGATVMGSIALTATASDNVGVAGVQFQLDGVNLGAEDTAAPYAISWDTVTAANGAHALTARARDAAGNRTTSSPVNVTVNNPDTTPPAVSMTAPANGASVQGTITVSANATDNVGVAGVQFVLDGADLLLEDTVAPYAISWNTTTKPNGSHTLTAVARDAAGNTTAAAARSVTVINPDTTPPTVSMTAPAAGSTVSGTVIVSATASDNVGVAGVQFQLDGVNLGAEDAAAPFSISWTTVAALNGAHTLAAVARDAAGNRTTAAGIAITVNTADTTPPAISMTAPANGASVQGTITVSANATDDVGVAGVQFVLDGADLLLEDTVAPYAISWNTTTKPNGSHTLTAVARDAAGNTTAAAARTVTVNNPDIVPPSVSLTAPANGASVQGTVIVSATASDNVGVAGVQFQLDGVNLGAEDTAAPYSISWGTTVALNGAHTLAAVARDAAGNRTTAAGIAITVNNPDTTPPVVTLTAPAAGSTLLGVVIVSATAADDVGVAGVQFLLDGTDLLAEDTTLPFAVTWTTTSVANGLHVLSAVARDAAGNTASAAARTVTVNNSDTTPPVVSMTAPAAGSTVSGTITVSAGAADNVGVVALQFLLDGANLGNVLIAPPFTMPWDTTTAASGAHTLAAVARDAAGNETTSAAIAIEVSNTAPGACAAGTDADGDGVCNPVDNCGTVYNPSQANTDGDREGGDACDITVTYPINGSLTCADAPPTITWTPESYHLFKVFVGSTVSYSVKVTSGKKLLTANTWTMTPKKWASICKSAKPFLFFKVQGKNPNSTWFEYSETSTIVAK